MTSVYAGRPDVKGNCPAQDQCRTETQASTSLDSRLNPTKETPHGLPPPDILELVDLGLSLIPIKRGAKKPPVRWKRYQDKAATREQVEKWQETYPGCNWAAVWGAVSGGVIAVDIDSAAAFGWCQKQGGFNRRWPTWYKTGRGWQYLFRLPAELADIRGVNPHSGVEIRCNRQYSVLPPSIHPSGKAYEWKRFGKIPYAPRWIVDILTGEATQEAATSVTPQQRPAQKITRPSQKTTHRTRRPQDIGRNPRLLKSEGYRWLWKRTFPEGSRHNACFSHVDLLRGAGLSEDEALYKIDQWRNKCTYPVYSEGEARAVVECTYRIGYGITVEGLRKAYDVNGEQMPEGIALDLVRAFPSLRSHGKRQNVPMMETVARVLIALYKQHVMKPTTYSHVQLVQLARCKESQVARIAGFLSEIGVRTTKRIGSSTVSVYSLNSLRTPPPTLIHMFVRWRGYQEDLKLVVWRWWRRLHELLAQLQRYLSDVFDSLSATLTGELAESTGCLVYATSTTRGPPK